MKRIGFMKTVRITFGWQEKHDLQIWLVLKRQHAKISNTDFRLDVVLIDGTDRIISRLMKWESKIDETAKRRTIAPLTGIEDE